MSTTGLLNRLKAKLSSQQIPTKDIASLAERENEIKQKAINQSICDAVTAAVNSEEFTKSVAERLASELKPSLKNLDPSSYCDKLQLSTDKISQQFEAQDTKLTHLSTILETSNSSTAEKVTNIEVSINNITKAQEDLQKSLQSADEKQKAQLDHLAIEIASVQEKLTSEIAAVPEKITAEITTVQEKLTSVIAAVPDKITAEITTVQEKLTSEIAAVPDKINAEITIVQEKLTSEIAAVPKKITAEIATVQEKLTSEIVAVPEKLATEITNTQEKFAAEIKTVHEKLVAIHTSLLDQIESAKTDIVAAATTPFPELIKSLDVVLKILDQNSSKLDEVNAKDLSSEVLTNIQDFNKLQSIHTADLGTLKTSVETSINNTVKIISDTENISSSLAVARDQINSVNTLLSDIKSSNITSEILVETKASNESLTKSTSLLEEIMSKQTELLPAVSTSNISHESHIKSLSEIKQTEYEILDRLKSVHIIISDQSQALTDTKTSLKSELATASELANTSESIEKLKTNLDSLGVSLNEVKISVDNFKPTTQHVDLSELETSIQSVVTTIGQIKTFNESISTNFDLTPIISSLETQSNQISDVKLNLSEFTSTNNKVDLTLIDSSIKDLSSKLESQLTTLNDLKATIKSQEDSHPPDSTTS
ncbi:putative cd209 antigen [Erysiphe neolycopersici]|uniref:Putative cd209 antigen n=1 Tax=Erysiphe neolycopersici TaxID=212602 RepID=A0A420HNN0_9PEZI|nr:putative cd209 antigen [Erysiphe neolycopersici]